MSTINQPVVALEAGHSDAHATARNTTVGERDANAIQVAEASILGRAPPEGSLAATAQSSAEKSPDASAKLSKEDLEQVTVADTARFMGGQPEAMFKPSSSE